MLRLVTRNHQRDQNTENNRRTVLPSGSRTEPLWAEAVQIALCLHQNLLVGQHSYSHMPTSWLSCLKGCLRSAASWFGSWSSIPQLNALACSACGNIRSLLLQSQLHFSGPGPTAALNSQWLQQKLSAAGRRSTTLNVCTAHTITCIQWSSGPWGNYQ